MNSNDKDLSHAELHEYFRRFLRTRQAKFTTPRQEILDAVLTFRDHFEAEQVLYVLRERRSRAGKATLYRTLPLLVECGILRQVRFDVKQAHYELAYQEAPHDHMVCRRCGRIIEFASDEVVDLRRRIAERFRFHVIAHRLQLSGLCWDCATRCPLAPGSANPATDPA